MIESDPNERLRQFAKLLGAMAIAELARRDVMKPPVKPEEQLSLSLTPVVRVKRGQVIYFGDYAKQYRAKRSRTKR